MLVDTHCHLDLEQFDADRDAVIRRAQECGVEFIVNVGSNLVNSRRCVELADNYKMIFASVGIHPHYAQEANDEVIQGLEEFTKNKKVVAVGEVGLDYHVFDNIPGKHISEETKKNQQKALLKQIEIAKKTRLPIIFHCRDAAQDLFGIIKENLKARVNGVMHCFSQDSNFLKKFLDFGLYISFTANITYKKSQDLRDLISFIPLDRLLLETDAPFMTAQAFRGRRNEPAFVKILAEEIARIRNTDFEKISAITTQNAIDLFGIKKIT